MSKVSRALSVSLVFGLLVLPACGDSGDKSDDDSSGSSSDAGRTPSKTDAGASGTDAAATNPLDGLINGLLGDGGLNGILDLFGDGGLTGLTGLFGDAGFPSFDASSFDPAALCAQFPRFCPDGGAGAPSADGGPSDAGADASVDAGTDAGSVEDASSAADANSAADTGSAPDAQ